MNPMQSDSSETIGPAEEIARFERFHEVQSATSRSLFDYADALRLVGRRRDSLHIYDILRHSEVPKVRQWLIPLFRGQTLLEMGRFQEAELSFREAAEMEPTMTVAPIYIAAALAEQERFVDAVAILESARTKEGDQDELLLNLGNNLRSLRRLDEAAQCLREAIKITPNYAAAVALLTDVERAMLVHASADP